jgi:dephospho-CoA kinase
MEIDRKRLAAIVFSNARRRIALNAIVHPVVMRRIADTLDRLRSTQEIVVLDAALLIETGLDRDLDLVVVVTASQELRESRLVSERGMSRADIRARVAAQASEQQLLAKADIVISNDGSLEDLAAETERVWARLTSMRDAQ